MTVVKRRHKNGDVDRCATASWVYTSVSVWFVSRPLNDSTWLCLPESLPPAPTSTAINRSSHDYN